MSGNSRKYSLSTGFPLGTIWNTLSKAYPFDVVEIIEDNLSFEVVICETTQEQKPKQDHQYWEEFQLQTLHFYTLRHYWTVILWWLRRDFDSNAKGRTSHENCYLASYDFSSHASFKLHKTLSSTIHSGLCNWVATSHRSWSQRTSDI